MGKKELGNAALKERVDGEFRDVPLSDLWRDQPLVLLILRRPGCGARRGSGGTKDGVEVGPDK